MGRPVVISQWEDLDAKRRARAHARAGAYSFRVIHSFIHSFSVSSMPHTFDTEVPALAKHAAMAGGINVYSQLATSPIQNVDMSLNNDYFFCPSAQSRRREN